MVRKIAAVHRSIGSHVFRGDVPPVREGVVRPLWSIMIPTFNNADHLGAALRSVLAQDAGPETMQIEVVDDASVDDTAGVVQEIGRGRVSYYRQDRNVGHIANFQSCILRSTGRIVHLLHGDDAVLPGFYQKLQTAFEIVPSLGAAFCRQIFVDGQGGRLSTSSLEQEEAGIIPDAVCRLAREQRIMTPSVAVRRAVYEQLGGFDRRLRCSEDWEMWVRIAASYPVWYEPEPLALYRIHQNSNTGRHVRSAEDMAYTRRAIEIFRRYLPVEQAAEITRTARLTYAWSALESAQRLLEAGDGAGFRAQLWEGLRLATSLAILKRSARLLLRYSAMGLRSI
jgi:glycosyltransferase involved in cell wall biosynthesis